MKKFNNTTHIVFTSVIFTGLMLLFPFTPDSDKAAVIILAILSFLILGFFVAAHRTVKDRRAR